MQKDKVKFASFLGIVGNLFLLFLKALIGFIFKSQALIADAFNSASDTFASIMAFVGNKISTQPADEDHNMGHGKAEYLFSLFIGLAMILVSLYVIFKSIINLVNKTYFTYSIYLVIICIITILIKLTLYIYTYKIYKKNSSILLKALYKDHRNDLLITLGTLISILFALININYLDNIMAIITSFWIIYTGCTIISESYNVLMDQSIDKETKEQLVNIILDNKEIVKIGKLSSMPIGNKYIIVLTIYVDGKMTTKKAHDITKIIQKSIIDKVKKIDRVIIHVNPVE